MGVLGPHWYQGNALVRVWVWIITELQTNPTVTGRFSYILIDLDHVLKPIVSLITIKTNQ